MPDDSNWRQALRELRRRAGIGRDEAAVLSGLSTATVKAYESGSRQPSRESLGALLDALKPDAPSRAAILRGAGFVPDGRLHYAPHPNGWHTFEEAVEVIDASPFPAHLNSETMEVLAANALMQRVWGVDFNGQGAGPMNRSFVAMLTHPPVASSLTNWEESVSRVLQIVKGHYGGDAAILANASPHFAAAIEHLLKGEPAFVARFLHLWATVEPRQSKLRLTYDIVWQHPEVGVLRFHVIVSPIDPAGSATFNEWIPMDEGTIAAARTLASRTDGIHPFAAPVPW